MAMYQETNGMDTENFANFSFPHSNDDINQPIPIVDNLLQQAPALDQRAATDFHNTITQLMDDLQKFQEGISIVHSLLYPSPCLFAGD